MNKDFRLKPFMNYIVLNITHRPFDIVHVIGRAALRTILFESIKQTTTNFFMENNHQTLQITLKKHTSLMLTSMFY
jgi:hypothetical protein